jgi:hypothetical protein
MVDLVLTLPMSKLPPGFNFSDFLPPSKELEFISPLLQITIYLFSTRCEKGKTVRIRNRSTSTNSRKAECGSSSLAYPDRVLSNIAEHNPLLIKRLINYYTALNLHIISCS